MTRSQLIEYLSNPSLLNSQTLAPVREVLEAYPFFQAGRMLWVKNLHQTDNIRYNGELKMSAAFISDRSRLFHLINDLESPLAAPEKKDTAGSDQESESVGSPPVAGHSLIPESTGESDLPEFVFPSADLLDYEQETYSPGAYQLPAEYLSSHTRSDESHSFSGWLSILRQRPVSSSSLGEDVGSAKPARSRRMDLIDNFLHNGRDRERIIPGAANEGKGSNFSANSLHESDDLMTETLANIFIRQKHYRKAADIFERLRLKYPEKSVYFARRIKELEELIHNQ